MKRILIPTDYSESAQNAMKVAAMIARKCNGSITLLHVLELPGTSATYPVTGEWGLKDMGTESDVVFMMNLLKATKKRMGLEIQRPEFNGIEVTDHVEIGSVPDGIVKAAEKFDSDIIVIGSHGASGVKEFFIGSNAEKVIKNSIRPVLTVKKPMKSNSINKIVFATAFDEESSAIYSFLNDFGKLFHSEIKCLNIVTQNSATESWRPAMQEFLKENHLKKSQVAIYNDDLVEEGICNYANEEKADIIAIGTHGRSGIANFFVGSISEDLVNHSDLPVLTVNFNAVPEMEEEEAYSLAA